MAFEKFEVVVVPFPFTDSERAKRRPALVISEAATFNQLLGRSVLAMITTQTHTRWPLDVSLTDLKATGLSASSLVRMKLFTLDDVLVIRKIGSLSKDDSEAVQGAITALFGLSN